MRIILFCFLVIQTVIDARVHWDRKCSDKTAIKEYKYLAQFKSFYRLHTNQKSWSAARSSCASQGASLFYPKSAGEAAAVMGMANEMWQISNIYLGISNSFSAGVFETNNGVSVNELYHSWVPGEPNARTPEACGVLNKNLTLNDFDCSNHYAYVCMKSVEDLDDCDLKVLNAQRNKKFFRNDYKYFDSLKSFYKIHTLHRNWQDAKRTCAIEGATLFYPKSEDEARTLMEYMNETLPFHFIYVGISDEINRGVYETIDGESVSDVYHNWFPGEPNDGNPQDCVILRRDLMMKDENCDIKLPFACKKTLESLHWSDECNMPARDYVKSDALGKCYKFHSTPMSWSDAFAVCSAELSYLAIIDSEEEASLLVNMTRDAAMNPVPGVYMHGIIYLGFHNRDGGGWSTVKGVSLDDTGYSTWSRLRPDRENEEKCGSMLYNGRLYDVNCDHKSLFICEHDVADRHIHMKWIFGEKQTEDIFLR